MRHELKYRQEGGRFHLFVHESEKVAVAWAMIPGTTEQVIPSPPVLVPVEQTAVGGVVTMKFEVGPTAPPRVIPAAPGRIHVFTHGTPEAMEEWVRHHNAASPHPARIKLFGQDVPVETINRAINDPTFFAGLLTDEERGEESP